MPISDDAILQAAATIVAAQITARALTTEVTDRMVLAAALEDAMTAVKYGAKEFAAKNKGSSWFS